MVTQAKHPEFVAECHGVKVPDSPMLNPTRIERINAARYEGQEIAGALCVVRPDDRVLEMGAGLGVVGAVVAHCAKPEKVMSYEANPNLIEHISKLYTLNDLDDKIEVHNTVVLSAPNPPKTVVFHVRNSFLGSSLIDTDRRATTAVEIPTTAFSTIQDSFAPTVMLIDIEGGELDLLRHASLEGIRAMVIEFHPEAYGKTGMRECKSILEKAGFTKVPAHCTRHVWTCVREDREEALPPQPEEGWSRQIDTIEHGFVIPPTESSLVQAAGLLDKDGLYCPGGALWRNGRALTVAPKMPKGDLPQRSGTWLWGGVLWMHFGHFIVESMARLWALQHLEGKIDGILFVPKRPRNEDTVMAFQQDLIAAMGIDVPLVCLSEAEQVERLIVPGQGFGLGKMVMGTPEYRAAIATNFATSIAPDGPEKLYISRSRLPSGRGTLIGEEDLETHLAAQGYTIYHPEKHDIHHQLATYKAAKKVIAAEGSALHLLGMVAGKDCDVAMVVRRPSGATRNIERHIFAFTGKACVSLVHLKHSWKPHAKAKPRTWMGELDMPSLQEALTIHGFIHAAPPWRSLDPDEVQKRLGKGYEKVTG